MLKSFLTSASPEAAVLRQSLDRADSSSFWPLATSFHCSLCWASCTLHELIQPGVVAGGQGFFPRVKNQVSWWRAISRSWLEGRSGLEDLGRRKKVLRPLNAYFFCPDVCLMVH